MKIKLFNISMSFLVLVLVLFNSFGGSASASDSLVLGCGSESSAKDSDGRAWDSDAKYLAPGTNSAALRAQYQDPSLLSETPYMTARVFTANATYRLPGKSGKRYWLRLHFYPAVYGTNDAEAAFFNVAADGVVLLKNFSAAITCRALTQAYLVREYALAPLGSDTVTLAFEPVSGFAFLNGLELVPVPDMFGSVPVVGFSDQTVEAGTANMQTMYRLNVGGQYISPGNDSAGMTRTWYDDFPYLSGAQSGVTNQAGPNMKIDYRDVPGYVAPAEVYMTARSMGNEKEINRNYNLTWVFQQIDPAFMYLVRLHFCDFHYSKPNEVVFSIYINNQTAQSSADVIGWSGGKSVPVYKDFAVYVSKGKDSAGDGEKELWVAVNPAAETKPEFYDAMLNGVEVFKLEASGSLAGPNPRPSAMLEKNDQEQKKFQAAKSSSSVTHAQVIGGAAGGAAAFGIVAALCVAVYHRKKRMAGTDSHTSSWLPVYGNSHTSGSKSAVSGKSTASSHLSATAQGRCRRFSFAEMKKATRGFDEANVVGVGGFGKVYKGVVDGGTKVAVKRSNPSSEQGVHEFQTEIEMLSELRHKHLVSLIGFCEEENEMCLVYDYMALGTLREHLYKSNKPHDLTWKQRLEICIGAAKGLHYLHTGAKWTIIHRDVKTTNILLDESWVAKVSDFGLSKTGPDMSTGHVSTVVKGSFGYLDPEYFKRQQLTEKSDVYSFGVVLFEVLCARPALNPNLPKEQVSLADWALHCHRKGTLDDIIDPRLKGKVDPESITKFADTAQKCLSEHGIDRPTLNDILWNLEFALQLQDNMEGGGDSLSRRGEPVVDDTQNMAMHYSKLSLGSDGELGIDDASNEHSNNTTAVFSQIVNPKGR